MNKFNAHILVVDDDDGIRSLVTKYLDKNNFLVTTAISAENAAEKVKIIKFDLIILDVMMPGKNGLEFIQDHKKKLDTPIILLTAKGETNERVEGLETGADDYLPKPFEPKELILRIKNSILRKIIRLGFLGSKRSLNQNLRLRSLTSWLEKLTGITSPDTGDQFIKGLRSTGAQAICFEAKYNKDILINNSSNFCLSKFF